MSCYRGRDKHARARAAYACAYAQVNIWERVHTLSLRHVPARFYDASLALAYSRLASYILGDGDMLAEVMCTKVSKILRLRRYNNSLSVYVDMCACFHKLCSVSIIPALGMSL